MAQDPKVRRGNVGLAARFQTATTAQLADKDVPVNTGDNKVEGSCYFNVTTNLPVWAAGSGNTDVWVDATGSTAHTPV